MSSAFIVHEGREFELPSVDNVDFVMRAISEAGAGRKEGWATFPVLDGKDLVDLRLYVGPEAVVPVFTRP